MGIIKARYFGHRSRVSAALAFLLAVGGATADALAQTAGPSAEGIKIHGRWTIEVRNPDGSVAAHHEFNNALQTGGAGLLAGILGRVLTPGRWRVVVADGSVPSEGPCWHQASQQPRGCTLVEPSDPVSPAEHLRVLNVVVPRNQFNQPSGIGLTATFTVTNPHPVSRITSVATLMEACAPDLAPASCPPSPAFIWSGVFTSHDLPQPIELRFGQIVQLMVVFSFS